MDGTRRAQRGTSMTGLLAVCAALAMAGAAAPTTAQEALELERVATFPEAFGYVQTVRSLPDGSLLVADPLGRILARADLEAGTLEPVGREGGGPGEWRQPDAVYPLPGDSTLLVDLGNTRLAVLDPSGRIVDSHPMVLEGSEPGPMSLEIIQPSGTDDQGRIYYQARGRMRPPSMEMDSSRIKRWDPGNGDAVVLATLTPPAVRVATSGGAAERRMEIRQIPLAPQDAWAVAGDGAVAVVRAEPYRVEWVQPDGAVVRGPVVDYEPVGVGTAEKERYLDERETMGLFTEMTVENGARSVGFRRGGQGSGAQERAREMRELEWPSSLPAFRPGGAQIDAEGRLWVQRFAAAGDPARYDLFDRAGRRVATAALPAARRIIGFDGDRVIAVWVDELGLNWLEAYR